MRRFTIIAALLALTSAQESSLLPLVPPANQWALPGASAQLTCSVEGKKIESCSWQTPQGKVVTIIQGLTADNGRLSGLDEPKDDVCGLVIREVKPEDAGKWACTVGVAVGTELASAFGTGTLGLAETPARVSLPAGAAVLVTEEVEQTVRCEAVGGTPAPEFTWLMDGEEVEQEEELEDEATMKDGEKWVNTLKYTPSIKHANKTLSCLITHPALEKGLTASTVLRFSADFVPAAEVNEAAGSSLVEVLVPVFVCLLATAVIVLASLRLYFKRKPKADNADVEKAEEKEKLDNEDDNDSGKTETTLDATDADTKPTTDDKTDEKTDEKAANPRFTERVASFFTIFNRNAPAEKMTEKPVEQSADEDKTEIIADDKVDDEAAKKEKIDAEAEATTDEANADEEATADENETDGSVSKGVTRRVNRFESLLRLFRRNNSSAKEADEAKVGMKDIEEAEITDNSVKDIADDSVKDAADEAVPEKAEKDSEETEKPVGTPV